MEKELGFKESKGVDFEYKQDILEGTVGIESIISNLMEVLDELAKSIKCQKHIILLREELTILQQESFLITEKANKESIIQEKAVQLSSEIYSIIKRVENAVLQTMKLKEEVDASFCLEELMSLLSNCKKINSRMNSHILIQDRMKTPPSSPIMSDNSASTSNGSYEHLEAPKLTFQSNVKVDTALAAEVDIESYSTIEDMPPKAELHQGNKEYDDKIVLLEQLPESEECQVILSSEDDPSPSSVMTEELPHLEPVTDEQVCLNHGQANNSDLAKKGIGMSEVDFSSERIEADKSLDESAAHAEKNEDLVLEITGKSKQMDAKQADISDQLAADVTDDDMKASEKSVGILSTIKGKLSNVFSKSEESVHVEEKEAADSSDAQNIDIEGAKTETGFIASIKNKVGGFFYSQQDSKSDTSSSEYVYKNLKVSLAIPSVKPVISKTL